MILQDSDKILVRFFQVFLRILLNLARSRISSDIIKVIDKILARHIGRNHEQVISYKDIEKTKLHQIIGNRKGHLIYIKNHKFSINLRNSFLMFSLYLQTLEESIQFHKQILSEGKK